MVGEFPIDDVTMVEIGPEFIIVEHHMRDANGQVVVDDQGNARLVSHRIAATG